jgi:hypothetical protein
MKKTRFKDLTDDFKERLKESYINRDKLGLTVEKLAIKIGSELNVSERSIRKWFKQLNLTEKAPIISEHYKIAKERNIDSDKKIFLVTSAQNATSINKNLLTNMEAYAKFIDAEILVIPFRYKNPTSVFTTEQENDDWWDKSLVKYLTLKRCNLNNGISILSDIKIQPTASNPLQGLEGMTNDHSCVVGHPRLELKTLPVMEGCRPKIMLTSGAITQPNYTDSKRGKTGEFHHSFGFAIVEIKDDESYFFRQVSANNSGNFIDLFYYVKDGEIIREDTVEAIALGDIHVRNCDKRITDITLNNLFLKLKPKKIFIHDIIDSQSVSHHNLKDPFLLHKLEMTDSNSLSKEVNEMIDWLQPFESYDTYIVKSNHDEHIDRFLCETDWRKMTSIKNAIPYMEYSMAKLKGEAPNGIVPFIINKHYPKFKCLGDNDNVTVKGYLMSIHGHIGASGSRGSLQQYSKMSTKTVTGHSHSIGRIGGSVSVGTSTHLRLEYNKGASAWINAHGIVNRLGKFQHIVFFNTKDGMEYTTLK